VRLQGEEELRAGVEVLLDQARGFVDVRHARNAAEVVIDVDEL
jgi:hypothetical protein